MVPFQNRKSVPKNVKETSFNYFCYLLLLFVDMSLVKGYIIFVPVS